jgi:hypothetical protein
VASGIPRLDYYTSGGTAGCPALLVEASAANGILNSADTRTDWTIGGNLTSGYVDVIGVSGNNITVAVSGGNISDPDGRLQRINNNVALASGSTYTLSFLVKKTAAHTIGGYVSVIDSGGNKVLGGNFDVSGSFSSGITTTNAPVDSRIRRVEQWGTNVYRCSETFRMTASGTLTSLRLGPVVSTTSTVNSATGTTLAFAAPQIELGALPTSFIPTTAAAVTRNADEVILDAVSGCIGQTEGTLYIECENVSAANDVFYLNRDSNNSVVIRKDASNIFTGQIRASGSVTPFVGASGVTGIVKIAIAYKSGDSAMYLNGLQVGTTSSDAITFSAALAKVTLSDTTFFAGKSPTRIRAAALYTTRLTNAELATLTTL